MFDKKKIKKSNFKKKRTFRKNIKKKKDTKKLFKLLSFLVISFILISTLVWFVLYKKYIEPLPPVEEIKNMHIAQTSTIYDKDWWELYKIFKENRTYVDYKNISKNMINALVAWEDQRFWTTPGFDLIWISRAALYGIFTGDFRWTSWLSQQLMKVTYLTNERSIERKVKEFYLSWKLNKVYDKEKILELYLNKIFFWSNAYWIEQASKTFFWVNSINLDILQASILASLPKAPSGLSPYSHKWKLLGYPLIYNKWDEQNKVKLLTKTEILENIYLVSKLEKTIWELKLARVKNDAVICNIDKKNIKSGSFRIDSDWCVTLWFEDLLNFLNAIKILENDKVIEYQTWRKDYILWRMLEDEYITFEEYKKAILDSFGFEFLKSRVSIKYPYFVMYIKEYLENKYWEDVINQWWFKIFTTLDSKLQDKAEEIVEKYWKANESRFWAKNSALIAIDNENWGILSMVGWRDYFDEENGGNNNMITARLQPGSTFKPFAYALAINNNKIWSKTPVYDVKTTFPGWYSLNNFDWKFMWKMNISTALNSSRNIPAIKMFYLAWGEEKIISFMEKLWVKTLREFKKEYKEKHPGKTYNYSAPMALWTWLMTPLELAWAYSTFANMWVNKNINPIIRIEDRKWNIIEDREQIKKNEEASVSPALSYIMNNILSDTSTRPSFWNSYLTIWSRKIAAKTWTSTKQYYKNGRKIIAPRNLWTIWYTPQITTVAWAWNTNWKELYLSGNGLEWAWPIMRDYMRFAHIGKKIKNWSRPIKVRSVNISNISGLLPSEWFPSDFIVSSNFINSPVSVDDSLKEIELDMLCNWKPTDTTPETAIKKGYLLNFHSIDPSRKWWEASVQTWVAKWAWKEKYGNIWNIITDYSDEVCERQWRWDFNIKTSVINKLTIWRNDIQVWFTWDRKIKLVKIYLWNLLLKTIEVPNLIKKGLEIPIFVSFKAKDTKNILKIELLDIEDFSYEENITVNITERSKDIIIEDIENTVDWTGSSN